MMGRRRLVALVSALVMLAIGAGAVLALVGATQSEDGREWLRRALQAQLARTLQGSVHLGTLTGSFLTDLTADSLEIRDRLDSVFVATGPIRVTFDPRDLVDGRVILRTAEIQRPTFAMRRGFDGVWSHKRLWPGRGGRRVPRPRSAYGSVIVIEEARVEGGTFLLMRPWAPADSLRGARRDSAIVANLADTTQDVRRAGEGRFVRTWRWQDIALELPRVRLAYPDSAGRAFDVRRLDVVETDPPFRFTGIAGTVRWVGDSIWLDLPRFGLPGSAGRANGKIVWGSDLPIRYRVRVESDSIAMRDVAWIDGSLPTTGGGATVLDIVNAEDDLDILEYRLTQLDVRSHRSRLRGRMTWGIGGPVPILKDVDLEASPLDFELLERFHQGPFPFPFKGQFTGRVRARGGPLNRFVVDDVTARFADGNVPGAVASGSARGGLDILDPAFTVFRGLDVAVETFDLRSMQFLNPEFPRVNGTVAGVARLDSSWLDVRLADADLTHRDGDAPESRFRGTGRITWGEDLMAYEMEAAATPVSFTALARSYPGLPLRGEYAGPLRIRGTLADLQVTADLVGAAGRIEADGRVDAVAPGLRVAGRALLGGVDPRRALDDARAPTGELHARLALDVAGDSLADLRGTAQLELDRSVLDGVRVFAGTTRLRFADGRAIADTAHLESSALTLSAAGALGLHAGRDDSLRVRVAVDSLGGLRRWLADQETDSLAGGLSLEAVAHGWLRDFGLGAEAEGRGLLWRGSTVQAVRGAARLSGFPSRPVGVLGLVADTLRTAGLGFATASASAQRDTAGGWDLRAAGTGARGTVARAAAQLARAGDTVRIRLDSLGVQTAQNRWRLESPARFVVDSGGFAVDSLVLRADATSVVRLGGESPRPLGQGLVASARGVPLTDLAELLQLDGETEGRLDLEAVLAGTRAAPEATGRAELRGALVRGLRLDTLRLEARAVADRLDLTAVLGPRAAPALQAEVALPLRLALDGTGPAARFVPDGPVRGRVRADSLGFGVLEAWTRGLPPSRGRVAFDLALGGTWARPRLDGRLTARDGALLVAPLGDVRWRNVRADVAFFGDSAVIDSLSATTSTEGRDGRAVVSGWFSFADREDPRFDLRFRGRGFHAFSRRDVADVDLSGELRLDGRWRDATLSGALTADRAVIPIPALTSKDVISLEDPDQFGVVDTLALLDERRLGGPEGLLDNLTVRNVPVQMGREVWLRSSEANINLGGFVNITRGRVARGRDAGAYRFAFDGPLQTVRGTYRLNLGPVQRTFEVQSGEIRFYGDPENNPTLDITALHTVRQYSEQGARPDVRVLVHLGGTLLSPTAELSTPDSVRVTNADLISYLVTGGPSYEIAGRGSDATSTAARVVLSSIGSVLGGKAAGGLCDDALVSIAGAQQYGGGGRDLGGSILAGTRLTCAKQLSDRAFVRLDAGLCQVGQLMSQGGTAQPANLRDVFGVKFDYLLARDLTASFGIEPPTSAVMCATNATARGFVPTPQQVGFDLFRAWRF